MIPALLITFREVIEASLIVTTILGILIKLKQKKGIKTIWLASACAVFASILLLIVGSLAGVKMQEVYSGRTEEFIEGILMVASAGFITWAVFFLHKYFGPYKSRLLAKVRKTIEQQEQKGLFILVFVAVFREGFEIALFLTTIYFSSNPASIFTGFVLGAAAALLVSIGFFTAALRLPVYYAFKTTTVLLILFAAGLLARGIHEFAGVGILPEIGELTLAFIPTKTTFAGGMLKAVFGITQKMDMIQLTVYGVYVWVMSWWVFIRKTKTKS